MPAIKVLNGHTLSQLSYEAQLFEAADLNGIGITEALVPGVILTMPEQVAAKLFKERIAPAVKPEITRSLYGQAWVDIALQQLGTEERIFELCDLNDVGITDNLEANTTITSPEVDPKLKRVVSLLKAHKPCSKKVNAPGAEEEEGIEFWALEMDFLVS